MWDLCISLSFVKRTWIRRINLTMTFLWKKDTSNLLLQHLTNTCASTRWNQQHYCIFLKIRKTLGCKIWSVMMTKKKKNRLSYNNRSKGANHNPSMGNIYSSSSWGNKNSVTSLHTSRKYGGVQDNSNVGLRP